MSVSKINGDPIIELWPYMSLDLQTRLLGVHQKHNKLSIKKVVGSLRGGSVVIARTLRVIGESSETPSKSDSSTPALESAAIRVTKSRPKMKCSPYVKYTCEVLLEKYKGTDPMSDIHKPLTCEDFFLTLLGAGPSPLLLQWQEDGFDTAKIRQIFKETEAVLELEKKRTDKSSKSHVSGTTLQSMSSSNADIKDLTDVTHARLSLGKEDIDVFISYCREQRSTSLAIRLKEDLEREGYNVWLDIVNISSGSDWHSAIGEGLRRCKALIAIVTQKYIHSKYCKNELFMADSLHKHIFPIFLEEVTFDSPEDAGVQFVISSINWIMMTPDKSMYSHALSQLMEGIIKMGVAPSNPTPISHGNHRIRDVAKCADANSSSSDSHQEDKWYHKV